MLSLTPKLKVFYYGTERGYQDLNTGVVML